jgi:hypothetical protein
MVDAPHLVGIVLASVEITLFPFFIPDGSIGIDRYRWSSLANHSRGRRLSGYLSADCPYRRTFINRKWLCPGWLAFGAWVIRIRGRGN